MTDYEVRAEVPGIVPIKHPGYVHPTEADAVKHLKSCKDVMAVRDRVGPCGTCGEPMTYRQTACTHATKVEGTCENCGTKARRAGPLSGWKGV